MSTKRKLDVKVAKPALKQSARPLEKQRMNDARAVVTSGGGGVISGQREIVEISSGEEEEDDESEDEKSGDDEENKADDDISMKDIQENDGDEGAHNVEPSFGDLVRINASEPIDVAGAFDDPSSNAILKKSNGNQNIQSSKSGASLGVVLTQALKTNDQSLLEQCLQETNLQTVRLTLQRLSSDLASNLLHHLAARLHRRPGRAGSLIVWIQWALVTHGGYLATQPGVNKELEELHRVVDERSRGLQPLLLLKGKLDMLEAQLKLRKSMQNQHKNIDDEDDEEAVIYVEGEESDDDEEDEDADGISNGKLVANGTVDFSDDASSESDDMPNTNGVIADSEDDSDDDSEAEGMVDDEAEETDADSGDEDEVDFDDQDEVEEDSEDEKDAAPPSKLQKTTSMFSRRR